MKLLKVLLFLVFLGCTFQSTAQSVYTTKTGEKYHTVNCRYLKYSKNEITLKQALDLGYKACSVCKPSSEIPLKEKSKIKETSTSTSTQTSTQKAIASQCTAKTKTGARCNAGLKMLPVGAINTKGYLF